MNQTRYLECPLPYSFDEQWLHLNWTRRKEARSYPKVLAVSTPKITNEAPNVEYLIIMEEEENSWCLWVQQQQFLGSWHEATILPYSADKEGFLEVDMELTDREDYGGQYAFMSYNLHYEEGFMPAIPIGAFEQLYGSYKPRDIGEDGFICELLMIHSRSWYVQQI